MRTRLDAARVLLRIAFRNLLASRAKTAIMGGIIGLGSLLVVFGTAVVDSLDAGMARSIQGSLTAHLQLYRKDSPDSLQVFGGMTGPSRLQPMENYEAVKRVVSAVPNVKAVVPMGIDRAFVSSGNLMDVALEKLRADAKEVFGEESGKRAAPAAASPEALKRYQARKAHVRRMISILREELGHARALVDVPPAEQAERAAQWADLERADTSAFWNAFDHNPWADLEFLENRIAPLQTDGAFLFIRYLGTDLEAFRKAFDRMEVVEGTPVPPGQRGILLGKFYAEEFLKLKHARRLDKIKEARARGRRIATDEELQRWVAENASQTRDILLQLDPAQAEAASAKLGAFLGVPERDLSKLLAAFFQTDDASFDARERFFYAELAPMLQLYAFRVGDVITIKAPAKSGYMNAVNLKIYGVVAFKGLEDSSLASVFTLMDLQSFRDLYGWVTPDKAAEIAEIKRGAGLTDLRREDAEAALFGADNGADHASAQGHATAIPDVAVTREKRGRDGELFSRVYSQEEIDRGVVMNVAVALQDPRRLRETQAAIQKAVDDAGLGLTVIDWKQAAGTLGQTMTGLQVALYASAFILFAIALVIMNNAMVMAMLQRVKEIGTMRAMGAQRRFVLLMSLVESIAVGLIFGLAGAGAAAGLVGLVRVMGGIRSDSPQLQFLFSGPTLMPRFAGSGLVIALGIVIFVSVISGIYPAILATRITPLEAMQSEE
jgi:ABC-type lipoprotein release transport system permease subunit